MPTEIGNTMPVAAPVPLGANSPQRKPAEQQPAAERPQEDVKPAVSSAELRKVVAEVAQYVRRDLNFSLDEGTGRTVVKVIDSESNEVVRQIPSEEMLVLARYLAQLAEENAISGEQAKGLLLTARV